ncbi:MAG: PQQ-binding-like beta-propeller repeat protein [Vicinamibacterales bacterium]
MSTKLGRQAVGWIVAAGLAYGGWSALNALGQTRQAGVATATNGATTPFWGYGGGSQQIRYSNLTQITKANASQLQVAWTYDTGEPGAMQTQPVIADGVLYGYTPTHKAFAVDAATGQQVWTFDSGIRGSGPNRGVMFWRNGQEKRVLAAVDNFIYALDPATGKPIESFGTQGRIDLRENLGRPAETQGVRLTSPGAIYRDLMIVGGRVGESLPTSPGDVRAYDVRTGTLRWRFHTIPHPGETGYESWPKEAWTYGGAANSWPGMALDEARGIVFVPTGQPRLISTEPIGSVTISSRTRCLHSTPRRVSGSGISSSCITISGIAIRHRPRVL